jgi:Fe-S-cluster-containing dehydrogenase component/DMSO reductase anchor subunit
VSAAADISSGAPRLVDLLLEEQQSLSAVERFSERHDAEEGPHQARYYSDLIPAELPGLGQQLAFRVDLDRCTGCKACVTACRSLNGLDADETWRDVGVVTGECESVPLTQTVTTACHHCEDPGCLAGCPVRAYEKDEVTGIVRHLDDQCIGCQYCVLKCPYDVPKYSGSRGIVRKCDMCTDRLSVGEAPACVQGCPTEAISIEIVDRDVPRPATLLAVTADAMPSSGITRPTTRYVGQRSSAGTLRPADFARVEPSEAHDPLASMLVLVQLSVGLLLVDGVLALLAPAATTLRAALSVGAAGACLIGIGASTLHLGRPQYAFRAFLGWRTSWMSREILVLGPFAGLAVGHAAISALGPWAVEAGLLPATLLETVGPWLRLGALATGLLGIVCSAMIYIDTGRTAWAPSRTGGRFAGSALLLGAFGGAVGACLLGAGSAQASATAAAALCATASLAAVSKLAFELSALRRLQRPGFDALQRSAALLTGSLRPVLIARVAMTAIAIGLLAIAGWGIGAAASPLMAGTLIIAFLLALGGELLERHLYFRAEAERAMPGLG